MSTTTSPALVFDLASLLGKVAAVDTSRVLIAVGSAALLPRAAVGTLVAIQGTTAQEFLIGMTERVTRQLREEVAELDPADSDELPSQLVPDDAIRVVLLGTYRTVDGVERDKFKRGADTFPQIDRECHLIEGPNLQQFMNLLGRGLKPEERLELGTFVQDKNAVAVANGDRFLQRHAAILGSTGSGKSFAVALLLERASGRPHPNIIVFDMHGEYGPLTEGPSAIATPFKIAGPGDLEKPPANALFLPYWLLNRDEMLSMIVDRSDNNAPNQTSRFTHHVRKLKEATLTREKKEAVKATFTVDSPVPYDMGALLTALDFDDTERVTGSSGREKDGDWTGKLTRFLSRLKTKIDDRRYGFLFKPPAAALSYDWLASQASQLLASATASKGIKIIDFSEVPSDVLPIVAGVFARLLYDIQFWTEEKSRTPFVLVCDEAHLYLPVREDADAAEKQALASFERIAKEGRKYGVGLVVVSQRPSDVSRTILSQCNNFLVLRLTNDQDQGVVRKLVPDSFGGVLASLPLMDTGEALLLGDAILLPARIKLNKPKVHPRSATRDFWKEWGEPRATDGAVTQAVENLRRQCRTTS